MDCTISKSFSFLLGALQVMAYAGLFIWMFMTFTLMQEQVHALAYTSHSLSLLARLMADFSIVPFVFSLGFGMTIALIILDFYVRNKSTRIEEFLKVFPYCYTACVFALLIVFWKQAKFVSKLLNTILMNALRYKDKNSIKSISTIYPMKNFLL